MNPDEKKLYEQLAEQLQSVRIMLAACQEAEARIQDLSEWMSCECVECEQCGKMPKECTGTDCALTCQCSECGYCTGKHTLDMLRTAIEKARASDQQPRAAARTGRGDA